MKINKIIPIFVCVSMFGCVQGTLSDTISFNKDMSFDTPTTDSIVLPACSNSTTFTTEQSATFDIHDALFNMQKEGKLTLSITDSFLSGDLSSFKHAKIYIANVADSNPAPVITGGNTVNSVAVATVPIAYLLSDTDFVSVNGKVPLNIVLDNTTLINVLSAGQVSLTVDLTSCISAAPVSVHYTMDASVSLDIKKP